MSKNARRSVPGRIDPLTDLRVTLRHLEKDIPHEFDYLKQHLDKLWEHVAQANDRLQDLEIQANLLTRLLTTLCLENLGMRLTDLRKLIRRIEHEAIEDSQITHLEELFKLEHKGRNVPPPEGPEEHKK